jgi:hypothetical protein
MNRIGIVKTDGVGFRNFILSNFMNEASQQFGAILIYFGLTISAYQRILLSNSAIKEQ